MKLGLFRTIYALLPGRIYLMEPLRRWGRLPMSWTRHLFVHGTMTIQGGARIPHFRTPGFGWISAIQSLEA
jgi:hypothetical protein